MFRSLLLQLARLGDLTQSLPAISSLHSSLPDQPLDLLCAAPLTAFGKLFSGIQEVYPWDGERWHDVAVMDGGHKERLVNAAEQYMAECAFPRYTVAYNLNNHPRSVVASHLLSERVVGAGDLGPLHPSLPPWVAYLRQMASDRGTNRIHLADAFCGVCGVNPPAVVPAIQATHVGLPSDLAHVVNEGSWDRIGIVLGAGDGDRRVPLATWRQLIEACIDRLPNVLCMLIGGPGEREASLALEDQLPPSSLSRLFNCVGRTSLPQLAHVFNRCQWVVGSDTGPLHVGVACGARAIGWYFSRARAHETGPYGVGHYVWQYRRSADPERQDAHTIYSQAQLPCSWPVLETLQLIQGHHGSENSLEWELWRSHRDKWGMFYMNGEQPDAAVLQRKNIWERLSALSSNQSSPFSPHSLIGECSS
ncbi:MAG: glycosyltransferase family 9 protein [Nitrospirales bacterium]